MKNKEMRKMKEIGRKNEKEIEKWNEESGKLRQGRIKMKKKFKGEAKITKRG